MRGRTSLGAVVLCGMAAASYAQTPVERGEYLVRGPAGCGNCHTPMGPEGFIADQELAQPVRTLGNRTDDDVAIGEHADRTPLAVSDHQAAHMMVPHPTGSVHHQFVGVRGDHGLRAEFTDGHVA